ncbi:translation initiation factor 6 [Hamiltosporidium magnivora]|uniref:Eukaryotic translation initiation factor 6 n=1 Tax=Hamiltosporidium magnivora TaxID=148818 RepID=A0A4Q9LG58_9MICR|nr:translation initiation factor 6 [Hamiltosporidium magnivora]
MSSRIDFEGSNEVGAFARLTNTYCITGRSLNKNFYNEIFDKVNIPVIETTINGIKTVGSQCQGNKNGLLVPITTTDQELYFLRNNLPDTVKVMRVEERLNALGNTLICNDHIALLHPDVDKETEEMINDVLKIDVFRHNIGFEPLVGTFAALNNVGMLVHPHVTDEEMEELANMLEVQVIAGTVNKGSGCIGGGMIVNDWISFCGIQTTNTEFLVIETVFKLSDSDLFDSKKEFFIDGIVK